METLKIVIRECSIMCVMLIGFFVATCVIGCAIMHVRDWISGNTVYSVNRTVGRVCLSIVVALIVFAIVWSWT